LFATENKQTVSYIRNRKLGSSSKSISLASEMLAVAKVLKSSARADQ